MFNSSRIFLFANEKDIIHFIVKIDTCNGVHNFKFFKKRPSIYYI
jgi:hypothetical protein